MERYTLQERIEMIKIHYKNGEILVETVRKTRAILGRHEAPCRTAIMKLVGLKAYKLQLTQELKPTDHQQRRVFADSVLKCMKMIRNSIKKSS